LELNWTTFLLEIINFLVLVWILKRFLYQPVLDVIEKRRHAIESGISEAKRLQSEAESLKDQYSGRLGEWEAERRSLRDAMSHEIDDERARRLAALESELSRAKEKARVADERQRLKEKRSTEQLALEQGAAFASRLLEQTSGPDLEKRFVSLLIEGLSGLSARASTGLREQWGAAPEAIEVESAYALDEPQRARLIAALKDLTGLSVPVHFAEDESLLAGLRITIGAFVLAANVRDELKGFAEFASAAR